VVPEFGTDPLKHDVEIEQVQVCFSVLYRESILIVPCNHLDKLDDGLACFGGELDMVCVKLIVKFVVSAVIIGFLRRA
jgi:hypothetical protein